MMPSTAIGYDLLNKFMDPLNPDSVERSMSGSSLGDDDEFSASPESLSSFVSCVSKKGGGSNISYSLK